MGIYRIAGSSVHWESLTADGQSRLGVVRDGGAGDWDGRKNGVIAFHGNRVFGEDGLKKGTVAGLWVGGKRPVSHMTMSDTAAADALMVKTGKMSFQMGEAVAPEYVYRPPTAAHPPKLEWSMDGKTWSQKPLNQPEGAFIWVKVPATSGDGRWVVDKDGGQQSAVVAAGPSIHRIQLRKDWSLTLQKAIPADVRYRNADGSSSVLNSGRVTQTINIDKYGYISASRSDDIDLPKGSYWRKMEP